MVDTISLLLAAVTAALLVSATRLVVGFNRRMSGLWKLLETTGRSHRVRELRDDVWSNLPGTRYLYDSVDFEDPEIRALKLALKRMHLSAISSLLLFMVAVVATVTRVIDVGAQ